MKKRTWLLRFKSIRTSILVTFSVLIISALLIFIAFSINYTEDAVIENSQDYAMQLVEQVNGSLDTYIDYMGNIAYMIIGNQDAGIFLKDGYSEETEDTDQTERLAGHEADMYHSEADNAKQRLTEQFQTILDSRPDISSIGILGENGKYLINRDDVTLNEYVNYKEVDWYRNALEGGDILTGEVKASISPSHVQNIIKDSYPWVVTLSTPIVDRNTQEILGVFFVDLNYSSINSLGKNISLGNRGYVFILDDEANIIYHPQQQLLYSGVKTECIDEVLEAENGSFVVKEKDDSKVYTFRRSEKTGWTVVGVSYLSELMKNRESMQNAYFLSGLILFAAAILLASLISGEISRPLKQLQQSMKEVEKGNFDVEKIVIDADNEISDLGTTFRIMTERIRKLMDENVREQKEKRKSELNALQSQINPHFLYNTLDSIIWMAESGKNQEVVLMTSSLARLLRQSISNEDEIVTIEQEISYTKSYLTIQKMRYKDQLEFEIDVQPESLHMPIVKLVIQPLVENAIYHGIKYARNKGMLMISVRIRREKLVITIADNGPGMEPEVVKHILEKPDRGGKTGKVGVYNVHNRLQLYYGSQYGLSYESAPGAGTMVFVTIPNPEWKEAEDETFIQ